MNFLEQTEHRKSSLVQSAALILAALMVVFASVRLLAKTDRSFMLPIVVVCILVYLWCFYASRYRDNNFGAACVFVVMFTVSLVGTSIANGGFVAPIIVLLPMTPLLTTMMIGPRAGLVSLAGIVLMLTGMMTLTGMGIEFPITQLSNTDRDLLRGFTLLVTVSLVGMSSWHYASQTELMSATIYQQATHDHLTGLLNRRAFDETLQSEIDRASRNGDWLSLIVADVDHFKNFNDLNGHIAGDECLRRVSDTMAASFQRSSDAVGRWGGEEFAVILPSTDNIQAERLANELREKIANTPLTGANGQPQSITITLGVGCIRGKRRIDPSELVELADQALYRGKQDGRNRVNVSVVRGQQFQLHTMEFGDKKSSSTAKPAS
ncbi:MAG: GGDEF domain-containing protein [Halieaceae bacterium]